MILAQTATAIVQGTGLPWLDSLFSAAYVVIAAIASAGAVLAILRSKLEAMKEQIAPLFASIRAIVTGVELSQTDILDILVLEFPTMPRNKLADVAQRIHDGVTARVEKVSSGAGTEPVVAPIVTGVQRGLRSAAK